MTVIVIHGLHMVHFMFYWGLSFVPSCVYWFTASLLRTRVLCCSGGRFITISSLRCLGLGHWAVIVNNTTGYIPLQTTNDSIWLGSKSGLYRVRLIGYATASICWLLHMDWCCWAVEKSGVSKTFLNGTHSWIVTVMGFIELRCFTVDSLVRRFFSEQEFYQKLSTN